MTYRMIGCLGVLAVCLSGCGGPVEATDGFDSNPNEAADESTPGVPSDEASADETAGSERPEWPEYAQDPVFAEQAPLFEQWLEEALRNKQLGVPVDPAFSHGVVPAADSVASEASAENPAPTELEAGVPDEGSEFSTCDELPPECTSVCQDPSYCQTYCEDPEHCETYCEYPPVCELCEGAETCIDDGPGTTIEVCADPVYTTALHVSYLKTPYKTSSTRLTRDAYANPDSLVYNHDYTSRLVLVIEERKQGQKMFRLPFSFSNGMPVRLFHTPFGPPVRYIAPAPDFIDPSAPPKPAPPFESEPSMWNRLTKGAVETDGRTLDEHNQRLAPPWVNDLSHFANVTRDLTSVSIDATSTYHLIEAYVVLVPSTDQNDQSMARIADDILWQLTQKALTSGVSLVAGPVATEIGQATLTALTSLVPEKRDEMVVAVLPRSYYSGAPTESDTIPITLDAHSAELANWASSPEKWLVGEHQFVRTTQEPAWAVLAKNKRHTQTLDIDFTIAPQVRVLARRAASCGVEGNSAGGI